MRFDLGRRELGFCSSPELQLSATSRTYSSTDFHSSRLVGRVEVLSIPKTAECDPLIVVVTHREQCCWILRLALDDPLLLVFDADSVLEGIKGPYPPRR